MTQRICIFGNSHVAALRTAWQADPKRWPNLQVHCVGAHRGLLLDTEARQGWLRPTTPDAKSAFARLGGGDGVRLADYDAIVVAGCLVSLALTVGLYRHMQWLGLNATAQSPNLAQSPKALVSSAAAAQTAAHSFANRLGPQFIRHLRPHVQAPILLTAQPRVSADLLESRDPTVQGHKQVHLADDGPAITRLSEAAASQAVTDAGGHYLPQPADTVAHHIMTNSAYMRGALRLTADGSTAQPPTDLRHANAVYGAKVLDQIAASLS